jgi:hypothetical protein
MILCYVKFQIGFIPSKLNHSIQEAKIKSHSGLVQATLGSFASKEDFSVVERVLKELKEAINSR